MPTPQTSARRAETSPVVNALGRERQHQRIDTIDTALAHDLGLKGPMSVTRHVDVDRGDLGHHLGGTLREIALAGRWARNRGRGEPVGRWVRNRGRGEPVGRWARNRGRGEPAGRRARNRVGGNFTEEPVGLAELADDLLRRVPTSSHRDEPPSPSHAGQRALTTGGPTVDASDKHRGGGYLSRQGPGTLRWALFEAGLCASSATSPDRDYYRSVKERSDGKLAAICVARKLARRCYHILRSWNPTRCTPSPTADPHQRFCRPRWSGPSTRNIRVYAVSSRHPAARQHPCWTAF